MTKPRILVSNEKPPCWDELEEAFGVKWGGDPAVVVAYGDTLHCSAEPSDDVLTHEMVHLYQQGYSQKGAKAWFEMYIKDPNFRLVQEIAAYQEQYRMLSKVVKDRNALARHWIRLAKDLAGPMYGNMITQTEALKAIKL